MAFTYVRAGQIITADVLNDIGMVGQVVFFATRDTVQSISSGSGTPVVADALSWETISVDDLSGWSAASATRYTVTVAGWYELNGGVSFASNSAGSLRAASWFVNGTAPVGGLGDRIASGLITGVIAVSARNLVIQLAVGDYVQLAPGHNVGAALDTSSGAQRCYATIKFVRPAD